jgi:hypothetical protein
MGSTRFTNERRLASCNSKTCFGSYYFKEWLSEIFDYSKIIEYAELTGNFFFG